MKPNRFFAPRLTAIGSGKGGTGKTCFALGLAQSFANGGERVLLCDADLGLSNTAVQLGIAHGGELPALMAGTVALKKAIVPVAGHTAGFDLLAAPAGTGWLAEASEKTCENLIAILRGASAYDRVVVDLGAGVGAGTMTIAAHADDAVVLTTPDPAAITDAYAFVKLMGKRTGGRLPGIVVNMAAGAGEAKRTAEALQLSAQNFLRVRPEYLGFVPRDIHVAEAIRRQQALFALHPQSPAAAAISALAEALGKELGSVKIAPSLR
jgi:flagellar biosynthesis protein FlhG